MYQEYSLAKSYCQIKMKVKWLQLLDRVVQLEQGLQSILLAQEFTFAPSYGSPKVILRSDNKYWF